MRAMTGHTSGAVGQTCFADRHSMDALHKVLDEALSFLSFDLIKMTVPASLGLVKRV